MKILNYFMIKLLHDFQCFLEEYSWAALKNAFSTQRSCTKYAHVPKTVYTDLNYEIYNRRDTESVCKI
jgi:hypothetical protein